MLLPHDLERQAFLLLLMCKRSAADIVASGLGEAKMCYFDDIVASNDVDESWIHCTTEALFPHSCVSECCLHGWLPEAAWLTLFSSIHVRIGLSLNLTLCFHFLVGMYTCTFHKLTWRYPFALVF